MDNMVTIDRWVEGYKVRSMPWIDGSIYFNVQYFVPGQSIAKPPVWNKTVYITNNEKGRQLVNGFTASLANHVAGMIIPEGHKVVITVG
jgi:hypothetical protein